MSFLDIEPAPRDHRPPRGRRRALARRRRRRPRILARSARPRAAPKSPGGSSADPGAGRSAAEATAFLHDQIVRLAFDHVAGAASPRPAVALVGLGGTGRGEMAPFSDVDLMVLTASRPRPGASRRSPRRLFHLLWDLKLKLGHSVRSADELIAAGQDDMTVRTAFLEARWLWGDEALFDERRGALPQGDRRRQRRRIRRRQARRARRPPPPHGRQPLCRRAQRQGRQGRPSRPPHALLDRQICPRRRARRATWSRPGLLTAAEYRRFDRAERFFWSVRCHLHLLAGRAEERLSFDHQRADRGDHALCRPPRKIAGRAVHAFLFHQRQDGRRPDRPVPRPARRADGPQGLPLRPSDHPPPAQASRRLRPRPRAAFRSPTTTSSAHDPVRLVELFAIAAREQLEIHPAAMRAATRDAALIDQAVRDDPRANALFLEVLTCAQFARAGAALDERGRRVRPLRSRLRPGRRADAVRHVPPLYGRRAFDPRDRPRSPQIERGELKADHPLVDRACSGNWARAGRSMSRCCSTTSPRAAAATIASSAPRSRERLCPRFGLDPAETETVAWLVRHHLLMSSTAFKRDLADPKTIEDFVRAGAKPGAASAAAHPHRGRHPRGRARASGTTGSGPCCETLFEAAEERLRLGHKQHGRSELVEAPARGARRPRWAGSERRAGPCPPPARQLLAGRTARRCSSPTRSRSRAARRASAMPRRASRSPTTPASGATRVSIFTPDREGLFHRICAGLASAGADIIDARIHTTRDGMALDNLLVLDRRGRPYQDQRLRERLATVGQRGAGRRARRPAAGRAAAAQPARVRHRAVGHDRRQGIEPDDGGRGQCPRPPGLARRPDRRDPRLRPPIHSAHIATYGERAVDVFYLTRRDGRKLDQADIDCFARRCSPRPAPARRPADVLTSRRGVRTQSALTHADDTSRLHSMSLRRASPSKLRNTRPTLIIMTTIAAD